MTSDIDRLTPQERWARTPRPLDFVRPRIGLHVARYLQGLMADEREAEMEDLTKYRGEGKAEDSDEIAATVTNLRAIISFEKELNKALIELVGPP